MTSSIIEIDIERIDHGHKRHYERQRCEHIISGEDLTFREMRGRPQCKHTALFVIEGEALCERHAGRKVLEFLLAEVDK